MGRTTSPKGRLPKPILRRRIPPTLSYARIAQSTDPSMKYDLRIRLVQFAAAHGIKPAARAFGCQVKIARKWLRRWEAAGKTRQSLQDRSRAAKTCPPRPRPL